MKCLFLLAATASLQAADFQRELSPDRPDTTESPITVEPGGFQVESSFWAYARDKSGGIETQTWTLAETNFKIGLNSCQDLQFVVRPYIRESQRGLADSDAEGFGDVEVRWKWNLWGNDGGSSALGLMPFVSVPTHTAVSSGEWEGGTILTYSHDLAAGWGLGVQGEVDRVWDEDSHRHEWDFLHTLVLGHDLGDSAGFYVEYIGVTGAHPYEASMSAGITWALGPDVQLDIGGVAGLNDAAEDYSVFQGITFRF
ncbi:transporter [Luteolibacter sp. Populi]|uniref:transporter n=1 Tax=Luteolibacter sp. Populi TaxID=3230487 RepID=UPI0034669374